MNSLPKKKPQTPGDIKGKRAVRFIESLVHVKGPLAGKPFVLEPWQRELVEKIFGTLNDDGTRRFRTVYCEVPRKNGKTTLAAAILLYMLLCDGEAGAEIFSAASTREQASIVYTIAAEMVKKNKELMSVCDIRKSGKRIIHRDRVYQACSSETGVHQGTSPHCVIFDEVHLQKTRELWEDFQTGLGARSQPLIFAITTAGHDRSTICWELHNYARGVDDGSIIDPTFLPLIFGSDPADDWTDPEVWAKANPSLGISLHRPYLAQQCEQAKENPAFENTFRRLHLNQWTEAETRIIPMRQWDDCRQEFTAEDYLGRTCYAGLDLSSTQDATALVLVFPEDDGGISVLPWFWIPRENINARAASDQRQMKSYAEHGHITLTEGNEVDLFAVADFVVEQCYKYDVRIVGIDPWRRQLVHQIMLQAGVPPDAITDMPQSFGMYDAPFKQTLAWIANGKFRHNGNTVLRWMAGNTAAVVDPNGNIRPNKGRASGDKIDGISAMLMATALAMKHEGESSAYATPGSGVVLF